MNYDEWRRNQKTDEQWDRENNRIFAIAIIVLFGAMAIVLVAMGCFVIG